MLASFCHLIRLNHEAVRVPNQLKQRIYTVQQGCSPVEIPVCRETRAHTVLGEEREQGLSLISSPTDVTELLALAWFLSDYE